VTATLCINSEAPLEKTRHQLDYEKRKTKKMRLENENKELKQQLASVTKAKDDVINELRNKIAHEREEHAKVVCLVSAAHAMRDEADKQTKLAKEAETNMKERLSFALNPYKIK